MSWKEDPWRHQRGRLEFDSVVGPIACLLAYLPACLPACLLAFFRGPHATGSRPGSIVLFLVMIEKDVMAAWTAALAWFQAVRHSA